MRFIKKHVIKPICWNLLQQPWVYEIFTPTKLYPEASPFYSSSKSNRNYKRSSIYLA